MRCVTMAAVLAFPMVPSLAAAAMQSGAADSTGSGRAEVLVLGVYHMGSSAPHLFESESDDVLAPRRQAEIAELIDVLERFRPTKIAVEAASSSNAVGREYAEYLAGRLDLTRNEIDQIGYRLAKRLGHKTVYPVDVDGEFPFPRVVDYAKAHGREQEFQALMDRTGEQVKADDAYLASHTILEALLDMNADATVADDMAFYYRQAHFGEPWDWAGADLLADWFRRNIRIYSNIVGLADSPDERILVVFGAGHLGWLRHDIASDPSLRLRKLAEFVR